MADTDTRVAFDADARYHALMGLYAHAPKLDDVAAWARPSVVDRQDAFAHGHAVLVFARRSADVDLDQGREKLEAGYVRRALQAGRAAGIPGDDQSRRRLYCGVPLFAGHVAADALRRHALASGDQITADLIGDVVRLVWPRPGRAEAPRREAISAGGELRRHTAHYGIRPRGVGDLALLAMGGSDVWGARMRVFLHHMIADAPARPDLADRLGEAIVELTQDDDGGA